MVGARSEPADLFGDKMRRRVSMYGVLCVHFRDTQVYFAAVDC